LYFYGGAVFGYVTVDEELEESLLTCSVSLWLGSIDYKIKTVPLVSAVTIGSVSLCVAV